MVSPTRDVAEVDAREAVGCARVAAHGDGFGHDGGDPEEVLREGFGAVLVHHAEGAAVPRGVLGLAICGLCPWRKGTIGAVRGGVPVVRNALIARSPGQGAVGGFVDCEEGFEGLFVQDSIRVFGGVVGHQGRCF